MLNNQLIEFYIIYIFYILSKLVGNDEQDIHLCIEIEYFNK
jgi:hypothetical protein